MDGGRGQQIYRLCNVVFEEWRRKVSAKYSEVFRKVAEILKNDQLTDEERTEEVDLLLDQLDNFPQSTNQAEPFVDPLQGDE